MSGDSATGHEHEADGVHATFRGYLTGFVLSVVLTVIPFWLVMGEVLDNKTMTIAIILALGSVQIVVHTVYFLHVDASAEGGWTLMSYLYATTMIVIIMVGSLWIMHHLHDNTHGHLSAEEARVRP
ncbi:MAG: cytochrome o ubiquinol oxidase subunit IV [Pseudomonadota bacterium]